MSGKFVGYAELEKIANKIWRGKFPRQQNEKFADSIEFGIKWSDAVHIQPFQWEQITDTLEMKYEKVDVEIGRFYVRRIEK